VLARGNFTEGALQSMTLQHDLVAMRAYARYLGEQNLPNVQTRIIVDVETGNWQQLNAEEARAAARLRAPATDPRIPAARVQAAYDRYRPQFALAKAELGDFKAAEAIIAPTAGDDDRALRMRGFIVEMEGQHARADWWFNRAEARTPHIPFADEMWGKVLLARGDANGAIAKFKLASQRSSHFADALEGWGEALMAKKDSGAAAKFAEAEKYAPNWGRLHLKWGEALASAGKKDEAQKQFALAARLDLSAADKAELAAMAPRG
jgi:tetratricopeptide (TPR) repeat protein